MDIKEIFLRLTSKTYPFGTEQQLLPFLPEGIKQDQVGNYFIEIGQSRTLFACHLDTFGEKQIDVIHDLSVEGLILTNEKSILGADDKAGMSIMLYMIKHNIPGVYYFFIGEELGGLGSYRISKYDPDYFNKFQRMISFDRRGVSDIITYQRGERTCSDSFANSLASSLNVFGFYYSKCPGGSFTDSYNFKDLIPECTNISVGYYDQHSVTESQNINHLEKLAKACVLIHWEGLPTLR